MSTPATRVLIRPDDFKNDFSFFHKRLVDIGKAIVESDPAQAGYHVRKIERGILGDASKIREETEEFMDSVEQGCQIMALVELSDLLGAVDAYLAKHHPGISREDLSKMNEITQRAFRNGHRR